MSNHELRGANALSVLLLLAASAAGQSIQVFAHGDLRVVDQVIPHGTDITAGARLFWTDGHPVHRTTASLVVSVTSTGVAMQQSVSAFAASPPVLRNAVRVRLTGPQGGTFRAWGVCDTVCSFSVDVANGGRVLTGPGVSWLPVVFEHTMTLPPSEVIVSGYAAGGLGSYQGNSTVLFSFAPYGVNLTRSGTPCGAELEARYWEDPTFGLRRRRVQFDASNVPVTPFAFFAFGVSNLAVPIPPLGCVLRTDILWPVPAVIDVQGFATLSIAVPESIIGAGPRVQLLAATLDSANQPVWRTSEVVAMSLQ